MTLTDTSLTDTLSPTMGKGGDSSLTTSASKEPVENHETPVTPVKPSDRLISWDEVKKHATKGDSWFVIEGNVYDTSRFARVHPGGHVITHWQGQDATVSILTHPTPPRLPI